MKSIKWHFRNNRARKHGRKDKGKHPSLIVAETEDGKSYVNLGLTHSAKRGHHNNVPIHDPQDWAKTSFVRDDIRIDSKEHLSEILKDYELCPEDIDKIWKIINKKNSH